MNRVLPLFAILFVISLLDVIAEANQPNSQLTPGIICTPQDPNYVGRAYPEQVPICKRNVSTAEKIRIGQAYGVPQSNWRFVEFDHLIPICAGGSNDNRNVWPEMLDHAHLKDQLEDQVCIAMRDGKMTQKQAIDTLFQWLRNNPIN